MRISGSANQLCSISTLLRFRHTSLDRRRVKNQTQEESVQLQMGSSWSSASAKVQLRAAIERMSLVTNKKRAIIRSQRREIATLLSSDKSDSARIRVEGVIMEHNMLACFEILQLYCELIVTRMGLIDAETACPDNMQQSVATIIYCAKRIDTVPEFVTVANLFAMKYGKEFAHAHHVNESGFVNPEIVSKLSVQPPTYDQVSDELLSIAQEFKVDWQPPAPIVVPPPAPIQPIQQPIQQTIQPIQQHVQQQIQNVPQTLQSMHQSTSATISTVSQSFAPHLTERNSTESEFPYAPLSGTQTYKAGTVLSQSHLDFQDQPPLPPLPPVISPSNTDMSWFVQQQQQQQQPASQGSSFQFINEAPAPPAYRIDDMPVAPCGQTPQPTQEPGSDAKPSFAAVGDQLVMIRPPEVQPAPSAPQLNEELDEDELLAARLAALRRK